MWTHSAVLYGHTQSVTEGARSGLWGVLNNEFNLLIILTPSPSASPQNKEKFYYYSLLPVKRFLELDLKGQKITSVQLYKLLMPVLQILTFLLFEKYICACIHILQLRKATA